MNQQTLPYILPLIIGALLLIGITFFTLSRRRTLPMNYLVALNVLMTIYLISYAFELTQTTVTGALFWSKWEYIGWVPTFPVLLLLVLAYTGQRSHLKPINHIALLIVPILTILFAFTNEAHEFIWQDVVMIDRGALTLMSFKPGTWYWVGAGYSYLMAVLTLALLVTSVMKGSSVYRRQYGLILAAFLIPLASYIIYVLDLSLGGNTLLINIQAYALLATALILSYGLTRSRLFDVMPIAREAIIEQLADGILVRNGDDFIVDINPTAATMFAINRQTVIGQPMAEVFSGEQMAQIATHPREAHNRYELHAGERIFEVTTSPIHRGADGIVEMMVLHDITRRVANESRIRILSQAVDQNTNAVVLADRDGRIEYVNTAFTDLTGLAATDAIGMPPWQLPIRPADPLDMNDMRQAIIAGREWSRIFQILRRDGTPFWGAFSMKPILNDKDETTHIMMNIADVSLWKAADEELMESSQLRAALRQVGVELSRRLDLDYVMEIAIDATSRLTQADNAYLLIARNGELQITRVVGRGAADLIGTMFDITTPSITGRVARTRVGEFVSDVRADRDYYELTPDARAQISIPLVSKEKLVGVLTVESNREGVLTERTFQSLNLLGAQIAVALDNAMMLQERNQLIEELDAYAHTVAHDLKQPVTVILGYLDLLKRYAGDKLDGKANSIVEEAQVGGLKLSRIIDELLLLSTVRDQTDIPREKLHMEGLINGALSRLKGMISNADATVTQQAHWPEAASYGPWIEEVWTNYISNAIKYGGKPPHVELGGEMLADGRARFWVRDNGPGISSKNQAQLFRQFERLDRTRAEGYGLGLSVVRRIIERLGGEVGVESKPGKGSLFYFILPGGVEDVPDIIA